MGGWSGGPVLLLGEISYPLVGIISEYQNSLGLLRIATLEGIDERALVPDVPS
jgi:hypothetical protein